MRILTVFISLFFSLATIAHAASPVINEDLERRNIVDSLTYRLETKPACVQSLKWTDKGSGADLDGFFFVPTVEQSFFMIGGYGSQINESKPCVLSVRESSRNPSGTPKLLAPPKGWELIWTDKGSGADLDGSFWKAIPPSSEYRCLGSVPQTGYSRPSLATYQCVHSSLTQPVSISELVWSDKGSRADKNVTLFKLSNTGSFVAVPGKASQADAFDIKPDATSKPDTDIVEAKLAERMSQMKAEAKAKVKAKAEAKAKAKAEAEAEAKAEAKAEAEAKAKASRKSKEEKLAEEKRRLEEEKRTLEEEKRQVAKAKAEAEAEAKAEASRKSKEEKLAEAKRRLEEEKRTLEEEKRQVAKAKASAEAEAKAEAEAEEEQKQLAEQKAWEKGFTDASEFSSAKEGGFTDALEYRKAKKSGFLIKENYLAANKLGAKTKDEYIKIKAGGFSTRNEFIKAQENGFPNATTYRKATKLKIPTYKRYIKYLEKEKRKEDDPF